jgi:hypothetical protein
MEFGRINDGLQGWTFEFGVSWMTENCIDDFIAGDVDFGKGVDAAEIYQFTATKELAELKIDMFGHTFRPLVELPLCLELVNEQNNDPFLVYNFALQLRWVDFPWNRYLRTTFAVGGGLSYASEIYAMDRKRHPNEDRSNLKFNLPIQLTFALPDYPEHRLVTYLAHHSGGFGTFDHGGINSLGIGYSYSF